MTLAEYAGLAAATVIFVWSPLFGWARRRLAVLGCAMCVGVWVGAAGSFWLTRTAGLHTLLDAAIVGVSAWLVYLAGRWLDEH